MKMFTLNDFTEGLRDVCPESILFSAVPKPDVDFVTDLAQQQTDEVSENLYSVYDWISKSGNAEDLLQIYSSTCQKRKYHNLNYLQEDKTITNCGITTGKKLLQAQRLILF